MAWRRYYGFTYFPRSTPLETKGGIKAQSRRGAFAASWWAQRWVSVLESFHIGARLARGRSYARRGQVISIEIGRGFVKAAVQGSRRQPYAVLIEVKTLSAAAWKELARELAERPLFAAKLLAGEMPHEIEEVFNEAGLSLFPQRRNDLDTDCSCPDWSNPCKHIAAVFYLLGEEFDRDPFLIFKLRGISREELIGLLEDSGARESIERVKQEESASDSPAEVALSSEPLTLDVGGFWEGSALTDDLFGEVVIPPVVAALPKRLGKFPFWRGERPFLDVIEPVYEQAAQAGMDAFLGER
jgi:uncharacterized Zn finger protein